MKNNYVELLSPVGNFDCLKAAVQNGADSVYFGANLFSARASADNFDYDQLKNAIQYAKIRDVKTNLTLNTLIKDDEFDDALKVANFAYQNGIDAIIVQDLGLAEFLIKHLPNLPIHASTQMTIHNLEGVLEAERLGFSRVVLSREVSLKEIKNICQNTKIEIETFIHGALCISYSGQCLLSSMIGGRSGNRGKCAQPCRLPYKLINNDSNKCIDEGYLLSTRDLCGLDYIPELIHAGVKCFKIEGRMKSPEYVAILTRIYRKYIDLALSDEKYVINETDKKALMQAFNRGSFSSGHFNTEPNSDLIYPYKPNNMGLLLGSVHDFNSSKGYITLKLLEPLSIGDTISIENETGTYTISELMINGINSPKAGIGDIVKIGRMKGKISIKDKIYKMSDKELTLTARKTFSETEIKKIPLSCSLMVKENEPISLTVTGLHSIYNGIKVFCTIDTLPVKALNTPITEERLISQICKTGNTPYEFKDVSIDLDNNLYIPNISCINELRRNCIEKLQNTIINKYCNKLLPVNTSQESNPKSIISSSTSTSILLNMINTEYSYENLVHVNNVYIPLRYFLDIKYEDVINKIISKFNIYIYMPTIFKQSTIDFDKMLLKFRVKGFVISNISHLEILHKYNTNYDFIGNYTLNIFNTNTAKKLHELGVNTFTLSPELNKTTLCNLINNINFCTSEVIVYGKTPVMNINYCLLGASNKCHSNCSKQCKSGNYYLKDRIGLDFQIIPDSTSSITTIYNSKITSITLDNNINFNKRIDFIDENLTDMQKIINIVISSNRLEGINYTNGNLNKEV